MNVEDSVRSYRPVRCPISSRVLQCRNTATGCGCCNSIHRATIKLQSTARSKRCGRAANRCCTIVCTTQDYRNSAHPSQLNRFRGVDTRCRSTIPLQGPTVIQLTRRKGNVGSVQRASSSKVCRIGCNIRGVSISQARRIADVGSVQCSSCS